MGFRLFVIVSLTVLVIHAAANMVFTQGRGFVVGASFGLLCLFAPLSRVDLPRRGHRLFGTSILFGKLFCIATFVGFGEKRCRKNLPLGDPIQSDGRLALANP